ncbi:MAG: cysteine desulfurase [Anaerolineae bacterium]|nr:cysteine desulfurase [Anaerolineae bacterium]
MTSVETLLNVEAIRQDFPVLHQEVKPGVPLVYLDNAASSQKPTQVIEAVSEFYRKHYANVHRGIHKLSEESTEAYEGARAKTATFINAASRREIVFTRNATESVNLVAQAWGRANLMPGDVIVLTEMEHHANIVPWQLIAKERGAEVRYVPVTDDGLLDLSGLDTLLSGPVKMVAATHMSNVLGTVNALEGLVQAAHDVGALVFVDGAQSVSHKPVDVQALDADFLAFSGHKMCGPSGIGVLYGKRELLEAMPPFLAGGDMIKRVTLEGAEWNDVPWKFEAGTPAIAQAVGLGAAVDYLTRVGMDRIYAYEQVLLGYALERLEEVPGGAGAWARPVQEGRGGGLHAGGMHPHDIAELLNDRGVAVRAGHHCAMPLHQRFNLVATTRASFYLYNTREEVDRLIEALYYAKSVFAF